MRRFIPYLAWLLCAASFAAPPYDITVTFDPPTTGGLPDGFRFYMDDCAATGPVGAPVGEVTSGQTFTGLVTVDGSFEFCVRPYNATGETLDPGPVATVNIADLPVPGPVTSLQIVVGCPNGGCTVTVTVN